MSVASSYAQALYQVAGKENAMIIEDQLSALTSAIQTSTQLRISLYGPVSTMKEKLSIISELAQILKCSKLVGQFLSILVRKNRLKLLSDIHHEFRTARTLGDGGVMGALVSADALSEGDMQALTDAFSKKLNKKVTFDSKTDAALLAGVKVTVNGVTYDGTLRSQLHRLRDRLVMGTMGEA